MEHSFVYNGNTAIAETTKGRVRGYGYDGISIFKGIPYAKARRFHAPEPIMPWEGILDATSYGYVCPLLEMEKPRGEILVPHRYWVMNEDCQNLNVWTPGCDDRKRPVMVWLHGGGYEAGSAIEQLAYEGENMCRNGQVVVVSVNHRLNILGYFDVSAFGEEYINSGNAGTDDIIAALRWIRDNISFFGGDPDNVTVFGQSGGGAKVTTLLQTPAADGLFAKGINMSGVVGDLLADETGDGEELTRAIMKELELLDIEALETVPYDRFAAAYIKLKPEFERAGKYVGCKPHPNAFYAGTPESVGFRRETSQIPLLVGTVFGEFTSFAPTSYDKNQMTEEEQRAEVIQTLGEAASEKLLPLFRAAYPERKLIDILNLDFLFRHPAMNYIRLRSELNSCTYSYLFNLDMPVDGGRTPWHCSDIPYVFCNTELVPVTQEKGITERIQEQIFGSVMAFARTGNPNHSEIPFWPASTPKEEQTLVIDRATRVLCNHDRELMPLYAQYMESIFAENMQAGLKDVQH